MKKTLKYAALLCLGVALSGCASTLKESNNGFPSVRPGLFYCNMSVAQKVSPQQIPAKYTVLGPVSSQVMTENVLCLFSYGDASYETMKKAALAKYPSAKAIINMEVDASQYNVFCCYNRITTTLRGIAITW